MIGGGGPVPLQPVGQGLDGVIEHRDEEQAEQGGGGHTGHDGGAHRPAGGGAGAAGHDQGHEAEDFGQGGHENGPETQPGALRGGVKGGIALDVPLVPGEFDDHDGELGIETDEHDNADLGVDIVGHAPEP